MKENFNQMFDEARKYQLIHGQDGKKWREFDKEGRDSTFSMGGAG